MELQHHRIHLILQAITKEKFFFNKAVQDTQFAAIIVTHFFLAISEVVEINASQEKNDYEHKYMSNISAHHDILSGKKRTLLKSFCRKVKAYLRKTQMILPENEWWKQNLSYTYLYSIKKRVL